MGPRVEGTVLVVHDKVFTQMVAIDLLKDGGFAPLEAANAAEALERRRDIHVVFSDVRVPGAVDGIDMTRTMAERWPHTPTIPASGHLNANEIPPPGQCLPKPHREPV